MTICHVKGEAALASFGFILYASPSESRLDY